MKNMGSLFFAWETRGVVKPTTKGAVMDSLPKVWEQVEYIAGILKEVVKPEYKPTHQDLTNIRDDLNSCAEAVQAIRDRTVFE